MAGYGVGGGGLLGIALENLTPPVLAGGAAAGGALTAGTYRYYVTAINANGETSVSNEITVTTATTNLTAALTWGSVTGATGYKVYRTAAGGASGTQLLLATLGVVLLYNDTAVGAPSGAFPTSNTATASGTYKAPVKYIPFNSESLTADQATIWRRPIRRSVGVVGAVPGNIHFTGDIEMEALEDVLPYFMRISRMSVVRTGSAPNYIYTGTPTPNAIPANTASLTIERAGEVFGYVGCIVSSFTFGISDGLLTYNISLMARDEATAAAPTPTWPTSTPFGAGMYTIEFPVGSVVTDTDTFEFTNEDNAEPQFRLKSTGRGADYFKYGERSSTLTAERDFLSRAEYDAFKALTGQQVRILASKGSNNSVQIDIPVAVKETYEVNLSAQGDLVRGRVSYQNIIDAAGVEYTLTVKTQELVS